VHVITSLSRTYLLLLIYSYITVFVLADLSDSRSSILQ